MGGKAHAEVEAVVSPSGDLVTHLARVRREAG